MDKSLQITITNNRTVNDEHVYMASIRLLLRFVVHNDTHV